VARLFDFILQLAVQQGLRRRTDLAILDLSQRLIVLVRHRFIQGIRRVPRAAADFIEAEVARDGEQPGRDLAATSYRWADL